MEELVERLRAICLALPEAAEKETWGNPTFRVRDRIFAMYRDGDGIPSVWMKAPPGAQELLIELDSDRFFRPPYVGPRGWIGVRLAGGCDWSEIESLVRRSYALTAPKKLARMIGEP